MYVFTWWEVLVCLITPKYGMYVSPVLLIKLEDLIDKETHFVHISRLGLNQRKFFEMYLMIILMFDAL